MSIGISAVVPEDVEPTDMCPYCAEPLQAPPEGVCIRCDSCRNFIMIDKNGRLRTVAYRWSLSNPGLLAHWVRRQWKRRRLGR
jgi:hypothetical protein